MKVTFRAWNHGYTELQSEGDTLSRLDGYNKTRYSRRKKQEGLLELASREAHEQQNVYFATILNEDDSPYCAIESNVGYFGVDFLREDLENFLIYTFRDFRQEGKTLFLDTIRLQPKHPQDYDTVYSFMFYFHEDKTWGVVKHKGGVGTWSDSVEESESPLSEEDYSKLCLSYPEFGEYDQLIRLDRIPTVARETILEVTDKEFPAFRQYLQRDIERYQEPKQWIRVEVPVFNQARAKFYPFNEVYLEAPKKGTKVAGDSPAKHLDLYVSSTEIVSRKYAQFNEVSEETAIRYLKIEEALERGKDATNVGKYSLVRISKERGFVDMLPELLKKEGITEEQLSTIPIT